MEKLLEWLSRWIKKREEKGKASSFLAYTYISMASCGAKRNYKKESDWAASAKEVFLWLFMTVNDRIMTRATCLGYS